MTTPVLWWVRKDLRLADNAAFAAAAKAGPVIPVFVLDEVFETYGACPLWRFGLGLAVLAEELERHGLRLILRRGRAAEVLAGLCDETGAQTVRWSRAYDPDQVARDRQVKERLEARGIDAKSCPGHLLFEPWTVETGSGGFYKVYTPFWKAVRDREVPPEAGRPEATAPKTWPDSETLADWTLAAPMRRGAEVVARHVVVGEAAARKRLSDFVETRIAGYADARDFPAADGTSGLSENLAWGEIAPRACWHAGRRAMEEGRAGAETFLKELVWREFAYHLTWHTPRILDANWREEWDAFPWNEDQRRAEVRAWKRGRTGIPFVDAAMREMYVTGRMHNRARMIVASVLTKHLMSHWKIGRDWFADCLIDWDPASNAMGWQWVAGSGPDAAPYFRVFNPETQREKFDPDGAYVGAWITETSDDPPETALAYFEAVPESWRMSPGDAYPQPVVGLAEGRDRALAAYERHRG